MMEKHLLYIAHASSSSSLKTSGLHNCQDLNRVALLTRPIILFMTKLYISVNCVIMNLSHY